MILEHQAGVRDVFKTLPNVYGEDFMRKQFTAFNCYFRKNTPS